MKASDLLDRHASASPPLAVPAPIAHALGRGAAVALGVSGGKDSSALALATMDYLDRTGHRGPRLLVHADLGRVEWEQSAVICEALSRRLGVELLTVRRPSGDMMDRWLSRWASNADRYASLECAKLILPWSTASMRFCTSELKTSVIHRALVKRFPGMTILSASGIRRQESPGRRLAPEWKPQPGLSSKAHGTTGMDWHPVIDWTLEDVLAIHRRRDFPLHEAYTAHGSTRVSCAFCILGSRHDILASAGVPAHADLYREMVGLEVTSTFGFQDASWLGDVAPRLLTPALRSGLARAKVAAAERVAAEATIPASMLYEKGWPTSIPSLADAGILAVARQRVARAVGLEIDYRDARSIRERYAELYAMARAREASK